MNLTVSPHASRSWAALLFQRVGSRAFCTRAFLFIYNCKCVCTSCEPAHDGVTCMVIYFARDAARNSRIGFRWFNSPNLGLQMTMLDRHRHSLLPPPFISRMHQTYILYRLVKKLVLLTSIYSTFFVLQFPSSRCMLTPGPLPHLCSSHTWSSLDHTICPT